MSELHDPLDRRLRAAFDELGDSAQRQIRPPGAAAVPAAAGRRRAVRAGGAVLALVLASGLGGGWWLVRGSTSADGTGASGCRPVAGSAFLRADTTESGRAQVANVLHRSPGVASVTYVSREEAYRTFTELYRGQPDVVASVQPETLPESWRFTLRCAADYPEVKARLTALPAVDEVVCACDPRTPGRRPTGP
jgi:cell division protein FtsX